MTDPIFRETQPNAPAPRRRLPVPELRDVLFVVGFVLAFAGVALFYLPLALAACGGAFMVIAWRVR